MIRAIPNNGNPSIAIDSDVQSDIEDIMTALGYGCTDYTLETVESAADGGLDASDVIHNLINGLRELSDRISPDTSGKVYQVHISGRLHPDIGLDGPTSMASRKVFTSREGAEAHAPEFTGLCTAPRDDRDMNYIDPATATTRVVELEVTECGQPQGDAS